MAVTSMVVSNETSQNNAVTVVENPFQITNATSQINIQQRDCEKLSFVQGHQVVIINMLWRE